MAPVAAATAVLGLASFVPLILNGCGGDSKDDVTQNIAQIATNTSELSTLVAALKATDLVPAVSGNDKITVFAPTDKAFKAVGSETLNCLLAPVGLPMLSDVLKYHVVPGESEASDLTNNEALATLDGNQKLMVSLGDDGNVTIEGADLFDPAHVIKADIMATNGVVHEVDAVLIPENFAEPKCGTGSIKATAAGSADLTTLVAALDAADLTDTFDGSTVYTVFAPTDEAFNKLGAVVSCLLKPENKGALTKVLTYHVVAGYDLASDITDGLEVSTLEKEKLTFKLDGSAVSIDTTSGGMASVTVPNVYATNGVVHVIDAVLLPKDFMDNNPCANDVTQNIAQIATNASELSTLVAALKATDLVPAVSGNDKITVFAPTDEAFKAVSSETLNCLLAPVGLPMLSEVLKYHVVPGESEASDLTNNEALATLDGNQKLMVSLGDDGNVTIKGADSAHVIKADIMATNGVVHELDAVLLPDNFTEPKCGTGSIKVTAAGSADLTTLVAALDAADLTDTFDGSTVYTVFAPTNEAFNKLGAAVSCLLKPENKDALTKVLTYHVVAGYDLASDITDGLEVATLEKEMLTFKLDSSAVSIDTTSGGMASVTAPNVYATNGVVHVIDAVLLPKDFMDNNPCANDAMDNTVVV